MAILRDKNTKIVGFFGQSGAGKTTVIRSLPSNIGGSYVIQNTNVIRNLFVKNPNTYRNPQEFISQKDEINNSENPGNLISQMYEKYIRSQAQLMHDFSTEVFNVVKEPQLVKSIMVFDRCPLDFSVLTECGVEQLQSVFGGKLNKTHKLHMDLCKQAAITNTINFFDYIFVTKPWGNTGQLKDGVRDQYLNEFYINDNWYGKIDGLKLGNTKVYLIDQNIKTIDERVKFVKDKLIEA